MRGGMPHEAILSSPFSENLIRDNDLPRARAELEEWQPLDSGAPSTMEKMVL
jgi:hypothetical protein